MKAIVTGCKGFVGSHMLQYLNENTGYNCYGLDRTNDISENILNCDLSDTQAVNDIIFQIKPDLLFHMAGSFSNDFDIDYSCNVSAAKNILDAIVNNGLSTRVLLIGSAAEYGVVKQEENPISENHLLKPVSVYGWSKAAQTQLSSLYASTHDVNVSVARTFNLKGKGISEKLFVGRVEQQINAILAGNTKRLSVGNTDAGRDYIDIIDACPMYHLIAHSGIAGEVYNVGSGKPTTIKQLLKEMLTLAGLSYSIVDENIGGKPTPHSQVDIIYADTAKYSSLKAKTKTHS